MGNKMAICSQHLATDPSNDSPVSVAVIFLPFGWSQSVAGVCLQAHALWKSLLFQNEVLSEAPLFLGKLKIDLPFFTSFCICVIHMVYCGFCGLPWFEEIVTDVGTCPNVSSFIFRVTNFCIIFCMKDSRKIGQLALD